MPGNTCLDGQTMISLVRDVLRELARHGVRRVVLVNGHYENSMFLTEGVDLVIRELGWSGVHDFRCIILSYWDFIDEATIRAIYADDFPGWAVEHGGVLETSLMLHLHPQLVNMDLVPDHPPAKFPPYDHFPVKPELTPASGCLSSAKRATAEYGVLQQKVAVTGNSAALGDAFYASRRIFLTPGRTLRWAVFFFMSAGERTEPIVGETHGKSDRRTDSGLDPRARDGLRASVLRKVLGASSSATSSSGSTTLPKDFSPP